MQGFLSAIALLLGTVQFARAQTAFELCAGCTMVNGAGYNSHPTDCDKFVHCHYDGNGVLHGTVRNCSFSTHWNPGLLTCISAEKFDCPKEKCIDQPNGYRYGGVGNCRGYWECRGGKAHAKCCPMGEHWNVTEQDCVLNFDEEDCTDRCFNDKAKKEEKPCDKRPVAKNPAAFQQLVAGLFWVQMPCAVGTFYVEENCTCGEIVEPVLPIKHACQKELYLPFDDNHLDQSGKGYYVENENVEVVDGVAKFNGVNSRLIVPRFTNLEHSTTVIIKINYTSEHASLPEEHAIVSNSDCGNVPSIFIGEDAFNTYYGVGTSLHNGQFISAAVPQAPLPVNETASEKVLEYRFDNGLLTGSNGVDSMTVQAPGFLRNVQCGLHFGDADDRLWFKGEISEVSVYLCTPESA